MATTPEAPPATGTFRPLGASGQPLYGPPAVLLCGATPDWQAALETLLATHQLAHLPVVPVSASLGALPLETLAATRPPVPAGDAALAPPAVILSGLREAELDTLMTAYRQRGLPRALWAMLTPANAGWTAIALLTELTREREALRAAMAAAPPANRPERAP